MMIGSVHPEFARPLTLDQAARQREPLALAATADERAALAARFGLVALDRLEADVTLSVADGIVQAEGRLRADVVQACAATNAPIATALDEGFSLRFEPEPVGGADEDEIELDADDCDVMHYEGGVIDLGEAVAQSLLLSLDPYPRAPGADAALKEKGVVDADAAGPFGALAGLRDQLPDRS